jgi:hypothetical protein
MQLLPFHHINSSSTSPIHYVCVEGQARSTYESAIPWIITHIPPSSLKQPTRLQTGTHIHIRDFERYQKGGNAVEQEGVLLGVVGWEKGYIIFFLKFMVPAKERDIFGSHLLGVTVAIPRPLVHLGLCNALRYRHDLPNLQCTLGQSAVGRNIQPPY